MNTELKKFLDENYHPGISVRLISMEREPQMPEGLTGKVAFIDDACQIHVKWDNGSSLALICGVDKFLAFNGPSADEYLRAKLSLSDDTKIWFRSDISKFTVDAVEAVDAERLISEANRFLDKRIDASRKSMLQTYSPFDMKSSLDTFISTHMLSGDEYQEFNDKSEYEADESEEGCCPKCGSDEIEYGSSEDDGGYIKYPWECKKCGSEGVEGGKVVFDGHSVDYSPYFQNSKAKTSKTNYKKYAIECFECGNDTFQFQWEDDHAVYKCENCHEFYDDGQEHPSIDDDENHEND